MKQRCVLLAILALSTLASASPLDKPDPLIGKWIWWHEETAVFNPDGTQTFGNMKGTWRFLNNAEVQRKYHLVWNEGQVVDKAILSEDQNTIQIQNSRGEKFTAHRAITTP